MKMKITIQGDKKSFVTDMSETDKLVIGRFDPDTGESPGIDLGTYRGQEQGVSRRHASLVYRHNTIQINDLGSPNGTYVNEVRLSPSQPHRLRDGDMIRVGFLTLYIHMAEAPQTTA